MWGGGASFLRGCASAGARYRMMRMEIRRSRLEKGDVAVTAYSWCAPLCFSSMLLPSCFSWSAFRTCSRFACVSGGHACQLRACLSACLHTGVGRSCVCTLIWAAAELRIGGDAQKGHDSFLAHDVPFDGVEEDQGVLTDDLVTPHPHLPLCQVHSPLLEAMRGPLLSHTLAHTDGGQRRP